MKKSLIIFILIILNCSFVLGINYRIDDGVNVYVTNDYLIGETTNLKWTVNYMVYGHKDRVSGQMPYFSVTGDDVFTITIPDFPNTPSAIHKRAGWRFISPWQCKLNGVVDPSCTAFNQWFYVFDHFPSSFESPLFGRRSIGVGTYNINMVAYGAGLKPSEVDTSGWEAFHPYACGSPITCDLGPCEYFQTDNSICNILMAGNPNCPVCRNNPNSCNEYGAADGYLCNGVYAMIEFYNADDYLFTIYSEDWVDPGLNEVVYASPHGYNVLTDTTPDVVDISQTITITEGCSIASECTDNVCYTPSCDLNECDEDFVAAGGTDTGCDGTVVGENVCDGAGTCVGCVDPLDCGTNYWTSNYQCNALNVNQTQREHFNYTCITNICGSFTYYEDYGAQCLVGEVCNLDDGQCCNPDCGVGDSYECGENDCGGSCGVCSAAEPVCVDNFCQPTGDVYWANMNKDKIGVGGITEFAQLGDSVLLIYQNHAGDIGSMSFEIWEDSDSVKIIPASETFVYGLDLAAKWEINGSGELNPPVASADILDGIGIKEGEFSFIVNSEGSNILKINDTINENSNFKPRVFIINPLVREKVRVGNLINFNQFAYDADDDLNITWDFGEGPVEKFSNCLTETNCNTTYTYTSSGTKIIEIIAREETRTQEAKNYSQVFAYDEGINVFPDIIEPPFGKIFPGIMPQLIDFNASKSYIANCTLGACTAGETCYDVGGLFCYDFDNKIDIPLGDYELSLNWIFSENAERTGDWIVNYDEVVEFQRIFIAPIQHWAKLIIDYTDL